jgi:serine/threonine protein kinase
VRLLERRGYLTPWQGRKLLKGETEGFFLGGYRVLYKIASGSFGRVYRGDDPRTGQVVAVKVLRNKWTMDKQKVDLFMREGKLGMSIRHPNIVSVLAVNQDSKTGQYFIVMEFVEGGNLRDLINIRKKIGLDESLRIMEECASGLSGAYAKGLTHRDIKPTNILIATDGLARLVDFGLAEITQGAGSVHLMRQTERDEDVAVDRTVDYAGLEKATNVKPGDIRSDIYFLGTVLYEMVTGQPLMPVTKDRVARMQARRYMDVEDTLRKHGPELGIPPPLMKLISRMVAFEPRDRFQNPTELLEAIRQCRSETEGHTAEEIKSRSPVGPRTLFVVEQSEKLKAAFRERFQKAGYRVLMSIDPDFAAKQYQKSPYHALIMDARTVGEDGVEAFNRVVRGADNQGLDVAAILILGEAQANWANRVPRHRNAAVLTDPGVTMKELVQTLHDIETGERELPPQYTPELDD